MFWIIVAAAVWVFIFLFIRIRGIKKLWSVVFWSILLVYFLNEPFVAGGIYLFQNSYYPFQGIPLEYIIASAGKGVIIVNYLPEEKWWQFVYLIFFAMVVSAVEYYAVDGGYLYYTNWSVYYSFIFRLVAYLALVWLSNLTVRQDKYYFYR